MHLPWWQILALCCLCCGSGPAEKQSSPCSTSLCKGRLRHSSLLPFPPTAGFSFQLVKHTGKQIRSHLMSLHDAGSVRWSYKGPSLPKAGVHMSPRPQNKPLCFSDSLFTSVYLQPFRFGLLRSRWHPGVCQSFWSFQRYSYFLIKEWRSSKGASTKKSRFMSSQAGRESGSGTDCSSFCLFITFQFYPADPSSPQQMISVPQVTSVLQNLQASHIMRRYSLTLYLGHLAVHGLHPGQKLHPVFVLDGGGDRMVNILL